MKAILALLASTLATLRAEPPPAPAVLTAQEQVSRASTAFFAKAIDNHRKEQRDELRDLIADMQRHLHLDPARLRHLDIAAAGAIERAMRSWKKNFDKDLIGQTKDATPATIRDILRNIGDNGSSDDSATKNNVWTTALDDTLAPAEKATWANVAIQRQQAKEQAIIELALSELQLILDLSTGQTQRLRPLLVTSVHDYLSDFDRTNRGRSDGDTSLQMLPLFVKAMPEAKAKAIITPAQWQQWELSIANQLDEWKSIADNHESRLKREAEAKKKKAAAKATPSPSTK